MEKEFVTYEQALALKELEFDEPCIAFYTHQGQFIMMRQEEEDKISTWKNSYVPLGRQYAAPTYQQAFRFFREKYNLSGLPTHQSYEIWNLVTNECFIEVYPLNSFRESELACLNKLIEIVGKAKQG